MAKKSNDEKEYPSEEQGIEAEETSDEIELDMDDGEKEADVYTKEGREKLEEDSEIEPWEEGFMEGAESKGGHGKCAHCGKVLDQEKDDIVEKKIKDKIVWFCSDACAGKGPIHKV